jgi:hypothetical protein
MIDLAQYSEERLLKVNNTSLITLFWIICEHWNRFLKFGE